MKNELENFKKVGVFLDSILGSAFSFAGTLVFIFFVIIFPLAILARCGIIPGAV